ncbi:cartilage intermediate layer protein 1-like [Ruditapes philippinarum]|uniref:cartilage intermediate layer protein 1-like n=1 Tax=Ruditapes philippinarum TaxID=129788 RepID=UPI00295A7330|nr:cartilage intermediate layer protein 1-like [Ruditapes philippinarum]
MGVKGSLAFCLCLTLFGLVYLQNDQPKMDVVLLMDSSDSHRSQNFDNEKKFALEFVRQTFNKYAQISLYTFGSSAYSQFTLNAYNDIQLMKQAITYMWYSTGDGDVSTAVEYTIKNGFSNSAGGRECVPKALVILTHSPIGEQEALRISTVLKTERIRCFILNMAGDSANANFITITDASTRTIPITDFTALESSATTITSLVKTDLPSTGCGRFSGWGNWTTCSVTCDIGLKFRSRHCIKLEDTDKDCEGQFTEESVCIMPNCTEPVNGAWSDWVNWGTCTKTCQNGTQRRTRQCDRPQPRNGGKSCPGVRIQTRPCAEWKCPDCNKACPAGAHISKSCDACECSSVTLFGQIMDTTKHAVEGAEIFLESSKYKPIAKTDRFGIFSKTGICILNENIYIQAPTCESKHFAPKELNATHWTLINATLEKYIPPVITVQPHDKVRMVGQSLSLCCAADGKPVPSAFKWFKNGIELENLGTNGTLKFSSVQKSDSGSYHCYTETEAGVTLSEDVQVEVHDFKEDTCGAPHSKLQELPHGCYLTSNTSRNNTINVGDCGKALCMKSSLHDNGSCSDYWPHHCCNAKDVDVLDITCDGFSYKTTRIKSCECKPCVFKTTVTGRAFGRQNGTDIPFRIGQVLVNGKIAATTNAAGFFKFDVPKGIKRVVATFHDKVFKKFMDTTKIIQVKEGGETFSTIVIPLRPQPIPFHTENGTEIHLGTGPSGMPPAGQLSIPTNAIVTPDGQPFNGTAKTILHFMDPRNRDDIESANGDFESESPGGDKVPLKTYGMFQLSIEDDKGKELKVNKPLKFTLDASQFNIEHDENGDPDLSLWDYDNNKGVWVETAKMKYKQQSNTRRKLLEAVSIEAFFHPPRIPDLKFNDVHYERVWTGRYTNCDHSVKIYENVVRRTPKAGICYASISVYTDMNLKEAYTGGDIEIKAYVKELDNSSYIGANKATYLRNGHTCLQVFCDKLVYIHVVRNGKERFYAANHHLPYPGYIRDTNDNEILFESRDLGRSIDCSMYPPGTVCEGPMYQKVSGGRCNRVGINDQTFQFKFAPFTKAPEHNYVAGEGVYDKKLSWYPVSPAKSTFRSCFMKVRVDIVDTFDIRFFAKSHLKDVNGDEFGSYSTGPTPDPRKTDLTVRGACIEFRCPGYIKDGNKEIFDLDTAIEVRMVTSNRNLRCKISKTNSLINITPITDATKGDIGFTFIAKAGINYGSRYGIFISDSTPKQVEQFCDSGFDRGPNVKGLMDPTQSTAVEFDCT